MDVDVAVVQMDCRLGDVAANLEHIESLARTAAVDAGAQLIVFPECATTGYFVGDRGQALGEPVDGPTNARLSRLASVLGVHLAVGVIESAGADLFDSLALFAPGDGLLASYRKVHLFSGERAVFRSGDAPAVVDTVLGRIGLSVCYDLMFPEYVRGLVLAGADLIINGTDWITDAWQTGQGWTGPNVRALVQVRALENGIHVAMAGRVGEEAGFTSLGHSTIAGPTGAVLATLGDGEGIAVAHVSDPTPDLERWRSYASYLADRQPDLYRRMGVTGPVVAAGGTGAGSVTAGDVTVDPPVR